MIRLSILKKIAGYFFPVRIREASSAQNPVLELFFYRGQWQLATYDAIYSDGTRYTPLLRGFTDIEQHLKNVHKVLVLGAGLGSAVVIMDKMGHRPAMTLVDIDETILRWTEELMDQDLAKGLTYICDDAAEYITNTTGSYDLIVVDVFKGRVVPEAMVLLPFLTACSKKLNTNGFLIMNYMIATPLAWNDFRKSFNDVFPENKVLDVNMNRILIAKV